MNALALGLQTKELSRYENIWEDVLLTVKEVLRNPQTYDAYFGQSKLLRIEDKKAVISSRNEIIAEIVEEHYGTLILNILNQKAKLNISEIAFETVAFEQTIKPTTPQVPTPFIEEKQPETEVINIHQFYDEYRFDSFVVGDSNQMAYHAALSVAEAPGMTSFNPLTIYGKTGLGKTHLMQAIGHFAKEENTAEKVYYITAFDFLQRFMDFLHTKRDIPAFHKEFEDVDILLIDDIQFLAKKDKTQECFYTIFSKLINMNKQIILTSDRLPEEIPHMQERLISKFKSGLTVDIKPPKLKTRMSILKKKANSDNVQLSNEVLKFMASQVTTNVRALEGLFTKVLAHSIFANKEMDIDSVKELLSDFNRERKERITIELIQSTVAEYFEISSNQLRAHTRKRTVAYPRNIAIYLSRTLTKQALRTIGLQFGGRDYSTVIYACKKIEEEIKNNQETSKIVDQLKAIIAG